MEDINPAMLYQPDPEPQGAGTSGTDNANNNNGYDNTADNISILSSGSRSDMGMDDPENANTCKWDHIDFNWLLTDQAIEALNRNEPLPPLPPAPEPLAFPHEPPPKEQLDGDWTYVEYIPAWCDPKWDDEYDISKEQSKRRKRIRGTFERLRPALLPQDALRTPTPYALRWGISLDRGDGRSRLSPTSSTTRQVLVPDAPGTATGPETYVDINDLTTEAQSYEKSGEFTRQHGKPFRQYLEDFCRGNDHPPSRFQALLELYNMIEEDQDLQRVLLGDLTTDEMVKTGIHSVDDNLCPDSNLKGQLHTLVDRRRWVDSNWRGGDEDFPKLLYNFFGERGEYTAANETIWMAMAPALQLVSRVLYAEHPFFTAIMDIYNRRLVDPARDPRSDWEKLSSRNPNLLSFWGMVSPDSMLPLALALSQSSTASFPSVTAAGEFLTERLELAISSAYRHSQTGKKLAGPSWATTHDYGIDASAKKIIIHLTAEMIWPLLIPAYSAAEKATCSFMVAAVLLHELGHAASFALSLLAMDPWGFAPIVPAMRNMDNSTIQLLQSLGAYVTSFDMSEPFFEEEQRAEIGWAFENQLFGGTTEVLTNSHFKEATFFAVAVGLLRWPHSRATHDKPRQSIRWMMSLLPSPPLPVDNYKSTIPISMISRLFAQEFWESDFKKFSFEALKTWPDPPLKVANNTFFHRAKDYTRALGRPAAQWIEIAREKLLSAGQQEVTDYLDLLSLEIIGFALMERRWRYEHKQWELRDDRFMRQIFAVMSWDAMLQEALGKLNRPLQEKIHAVEAMCAQYVRGQLALGIASPNIDQRQMPTVAAYLESHQQEAETALRGFLAELEALSRLAGIELQNVEHMTVEYLHQTPADRQTLQQRWCEKLYTRVESLYEKTLADCMERIEQVQRDFSDLGAMSDELNPPLIRVHSKMETLKKLFIHARSFIDKNYVHETGDLWKNRFASVASGCYEKHRSKKMRKVANRFMKLLPPPLQKLVDTWLGILGNRQHQLGNLPHAPIEDLKKRLEAWRLETAAEAQRLGLVYPMLSGGPDPGAGPGPASAISRMLGPQATGLSQIRQFAIRKNTLPDTPPRTPGAENRAWTPQPGPVFGTITPPGRAGTPAGFPSVPDPTTGFVRYSKTPTAFPQHTGASWITSNPNPPAAQSPHALDMFGGLDPRLAYQVHTPFPNPFSAHNTVNVDVETVAGYPLRDSERMYGKAAYKEMEAEQQQQDELLRQQEAVEAAAAIVTPAGASIANFPLSDPLAYPGGFLATGTAGDPAADQDLLPQLDPSRLNGPPLQFVNPTLLSQMPYQQPPMINPAFQFIDPNLLAPLPNLPLPPMSNPFQQTPGQNNEGLQGNLPLPPGPP